MRTDHRRNKSKTRPQGPKPPPTSLCPNFGPAPTKPCPGSIKGSTQPCPVKRRNSSARGSRTYIAPVDISRGANAFFQYEPAKPKACCQCPSTNEMQSAADFPCCPCPPSVQQQGFSQEMESGNDLCCECPSPMEQAEFIGSRCCECSPQEYQQNDIISAQMDGWNSNNSKCCSCPPQTTEQFGNNLRSSQKQSNRNLNSFIPQRQIDSNSPATYDQCCQCPSFVQVQQYQNLDQCCPCPQHVEQQFSNNFAVEQQENYPNPPSAASQCCPCPQNTWQQFDNDPNLQCCACPPYDEQQYGNLSNQVNQECCPCPSTSNKEVYIDMPDEENYIQICVPPCQLSQCQSQAQQTNIPKTANQSCCACSQEMIPKSARGKKAYSKRSPAKEQVLCRPCVISDSDQPIVQTEDTDYPTMCCSCTRTVNNTNTALNQHRNDNCKCGVSEQNSWTYAMAPAYFINQCPSGCQSRVCCKVCNRSLPSYCFACPPPCHL